jgi:hypothetical protein
VTRRKSDSELAQAEAALRRIRKKEAEARACSWIEAPGRGLFLLKRYQDSREDKAEVDSIAAELLDKYGAREYTRAEITTIIEGKQHFPAPDAEVATRAARLGAVQRDVVRDIARFEATRNGSNLSDFFYRPQQLGGKRDKRIEELMEQPETAERDAEIRRLTRRDAARRAQAQDFSGKAGIYRVGEREITKADFLRAVRRLENMSLITAYIPPKHGSKDRSYFFGVESKHRYSLDPAKRQREYAWCLTGEGKLVAYAILHAERWQPGLLAEFSGRLPRQQKKRLGLDLDAQSANEETVDMVRHAAERIALERRAKELRKERGRGSVEQHTCGERCGK